MQENLVIVESPAKAKTIEKFLGKNFLVRSSFGHVRDLAKKDFGIDVANNYAPQYIVSEDKQKVVSELKQLAREAKMVWLASDEDREGEAISWHLSEVLQLDMKKTKRIVFHEITKNAILHAIENPRGINLDLVNAQQARRVLDRLVGFELSPVLWKKVKPSLSAGRVQSVAVRLIVDREREIQAFNSVSAFRVVGTFKVKDAANKLHDLRAVLNRTFDTKPEAHKFLENCNGAKYSVADIVTKPATKSPAAPFTTSTLQQEASRKLGFSVAQTMAVAQKLYEAGFITYMRTDSTNLSDTAVGAAKEQIIAEFGEKYSNPRQYKTKAKGAQEAHEAIRPTYMDKRDIEGNNNDKRLYELIWKRTIASQMADAQLERTTATIDISTRKELFVATGEVIKFDGFLRVYIESTDDERGDGEENKAMLPPIKKGMDLPMSNITATQKYSQHPPRYTEAILVKKLEELGIGRPSTYAPIISTIQERGYVVKESREGEKRKYVVFVLQNNAIEETTKTEMAGAERNKMFPTDVGMVVTDFLLQHFTNIMDFNFTAKVEKDFDEIAQGKMVWYNMIDGFYKPFHGKVSDTLEHSDRSSGERILGNDPKTGKPVSVKIGRYGPLVQLGKTGGDENSEKPQFASLLKGQRMESITLDEALDLFKLPRNVGQYENKEVVIGVGRFGPYVRHDSKFVSLKKEDNPLTITLERAIALINEKREADDKKLIQQFSQNGMQILNGRFGPYISLNKENFKIPKSMNPATLTFEECMKIVDSAAKQAGKTAAKTADKAEPKTTGAAKTGAAKKTSTTKTAAKKTTPSKSKKK